jgi:hypothetical protein
MVALAAGSAAPASAAAILVNSNTAFTVSWLNTTTDPDLSAQATFTVTNWSTSSFNLAISNVQNTTAATPNINARLTSFGFGLTPNATGFSNIVNGSIYSWGFTNFPSFQTVDVCAFAGINCAGGAFAGLNQNQGLLPNDIMSITIFGSFANGVTFNPIAARFQTAVGSFNFDGTVCPGCGPNPQIPPIPEPASVVLLASGLALAARRLRTRRERP